MKLFNDIQLRSFFIWSLIFLCLGCGFVPRRAEHSLEPSAGSKYSSQACYYYVISQMHKKQSDLDRAIVLMKKAIAADPETLFLQYELAMLHMLQREQQRALKVAEGIIEKDRSHIDALMLVGRIYQGLKQMESAKKAYERVLEVDPKQENIYVLLGKIYMNANELDKALGIYKRLIAHFPNSYLGHFFIGQILAEQGDMAAAEEKFKQTIALAPELEEPNYELLKLYEKQGDVGKIQAVYEEILAHDPNNADVLMDLALLYHKNGRKDQAGRIFRDLGRRSLKDRTLIPKVARKFLESEAYEDAVVSLDGMLKGAPDSSAFNYLIGIAKDGNGDKKAAISHLKKVKVDSRFFTSSAIHMAFLYQELELLSDAIAVLEDALLKVKPNAELLLYLGSFYEETEKYEAAETVFLKGIEIAPKNVKIHFRLGVTYDKRGNRTSSIQQMKTVIALDPTHTHALNYLGYTYAEMGIELDQAEAYVQKALETQPDDGYITDSLGWIYYKKGFFDRAVTVLEKAVSLVPDDPIILEHLGDAYHKLNNRVKALEYYHRSLEKREKDQKPIKEKIDKLTREGN